MEKQIRNSMAHPVSEKALKQPEVKPEVDVWEVSGGRKITFASRKRVVTAVGAQ